MTRLIIYSADPWDSAISHLRIREPANTLGWELYPAKINNEIDVKIIHDADYIIIQRDFPRFSQCLEIIQTAKRKGVPVIYEVDDCLFNTPDYNKQFEAYRYYFNGILNTIIAADRVIVSSKVLYHQLIQFNRNIVLFPNYLPDNIWQLRQPEMGNSTNLTIGYMGGNTHRQDLEWLASVLIHIFEQHNHIELKIWGCHPPEPLMQRSEVQFLDIDFQDYTQFARYFQNQSCDFFIAPLLDTPFNQGKSGIKFLEYSALGIPGVYMKMDPYNDYVIDGENGYLADSLPEWEEKISLLISDANNRFRLAQNAQETARQNFLSGHFREWEKAISGGVAPLENVNEADSHLPIDLIQIINAKTQQAIWDVQRELANARKDIAGLNQQIRDLENEKSGLNEHLQAILNSRTWKIAKSIQSVTGAFKSKRE
jgi:glycosyltransferase involved in cell wall biosynthesis